jgi:hypothetical protein
MRGTVRVVFLAVLMVAMAGAAQADTMIFPFTVGYTANYSATDGTTSWTSTISIISPGTMQLDNWDGPGQSGTMDVQLTSDTFSLDEGPGLQPYFKQLSQGQSWTFTGDTGLETTATVQNITSNVYKVYYHSTSQNQYMYWQPGVGLIRSEDFGMDPAHIHQMTSYATPIPPGFWLLGSGLLGLAGWRRLRKS